LRRVTLVTISAPVIVGSDQTWNIVGTGANGSSLTVSGGLTGTDDITKTGAGALTISAVNSIYDGDFIWNGGSLTLTPTGTGGNNFVLNGVISGSGTGPLLKNGAGILALNGANTYTGGTTLNGGTTILGNKQAFGSDTVTTSTSTPTLQASVDLSGVNAVANNFILDSNLTVSGTNSLEIAGTTTINTASRTLTNNLTGPAALTLTGNVFLGDVGGARNLTVDGTGSTVINGVVGNGPVAGGWLVKSGTGTLTLGAANTYTGFTIINQGTLTLATGVNQTMTNTFYFGSSSSATTAGTLDLSNASATFTATTAFWNQINSATNTPAILIGAGQSLNLNGNVLIGNNSLASTTTLMTASGLGSMIVTNAASGASFRVGGYSGGTAGQGNRASADLSGLAVLTISLNTTNGIVAVNSNTTANTADKYSTLTLAATTNITAKTLSVGDGGAYGGSAGQINALKLGSVVTNINVDTFNVGTGMRDFGSVSFNAGTGSLVVRNAAGTGRAAFNMGTTGGGTGVGSLTNQNTFDVTGHSADLLFGAVAIGTQATRGDTLTNVFSFDTGTLDMTSLTMSVKTGTPLAGTHIVNSTVNLGGGTVIIGTIAQMGQTSTSDNTANATLNITGGSVTIGTGTGTAITMASADTGTTANGAINITGGSTTVIGDIVRTGGAGTTSATVTLDGGSLNMSGKNIGTGASAVTFNARSGTLSNLAELNGGGTLTKTTTGILVMEGANSYTGATTVSDGTLQVGGVTSGSLTGTSGVTVGTGARLSGSGSVSGSTVIGGGAILAPGVGATDGSNQTLTFTAAGTAVEVQNGGQIQLGLTSSTKIDNAFDWTVNNALAYLNTLTTDGTDFTTSISYVDNWKTAGSGYDSLKLTNGIFNLGVTDETAGGTIKLLDNGPTSYSAGNIFKLLDWSTVGTADSLLVGSGGFTLSNLNLDSVALGSGLAWDTSAFTTYGVIVVVPEPSRALFLLLGLLGLVLRRWRHKSQTAARVKGKVAFPPAFWLGLS
jgi:fibronectin-binding autotransporter adhesin